MASSVAQSAPWMAVVPSRELRSRLLSALDSHVPWIVVVRNPHPDNLSALLKNGTEADVITLSRRAVTARILPDAVCWRRDTLAAVLAGGCSIPTTFRMIRHARRMGARVVDITVPTASRGTFRPTWADATHQ